MFYTATFFYAFNEKSLVIESDNPGTFSVCLGAVLDKFDLVSDLGDLEKAATSHFFGMQRTDYAYVIGTEYQHTTGNTGTLVINIGKEN